MHYGNIKTNDVANGIGCRTVLFVSGCTNRCKGCFQPETWDFNYGNEFTKDTEDFIIKETTPYYIDGLTLLGGDPFEPENQRVLVNFLRRFKKVLPHKTIWAYTGFTYEMLTTDGSYPRCEVTDEMLSYINVLVDGPFVERLKNISLQFRGSSNQRIIDLDRTRECGGVTFWGTREY